MIKKTDYNYMTEFLDIEFDRLIIVLFFCCSFIVAIYLISLNSFFIGILFFCLSTFICYIYCRLDKKLKELRKAMVW